MIARKIGTRQELREFTRYTNEYLMKLGTGEGNMNLSWELRGGPSQVRF
jgi:hypothetical protein